MSAQVRAHFDALAGAGRLAEGAGRLISGEAGSREEGTQVRFQWRVAAGGILEARFLAYGCPYTLATCEWLVRQLPGRRREQPWPGGPEDWRRALDIPLERLGRLLVVEDALRATADAWARNALC